MASDVITYEDLAELYAVALPSGAAIMREFADAEHRDLIADAADNRDYWDGFDDESAIQEIGKVLKKVSARTGKDHTDTCWKTHAPCLTLRINAIIVGDS
jgi:hypothetical protein